MAWRLPGFRTQSVKTTNNELSRKGISIMSEQANVRTLANAYSSFKKGDIEEVLKVLTDDVEWTTPGPPELIPVAGKRRGRQQVAAFFSTLNQTENVELFEPQEYIAQGDKVVALIKISRKSQNNRKNCGS
jgi:ketosteroid isomerase-like protein